MTYAINCDNVAIRDDKRSYQCDELIIPFYKTDTTILEFLSQHANQKITCDIGDIESLNLLSTIAKKYPEYNLHARMPHTQTELIEAAGQSGLPFFTSEFCIDIDQIYKQISLGCSEVYICENLGFNLVNIRKITELYGIEIRIFPNIAQSKWEDAPEETKFWIRPEDMKYYEDYVDTCELWPLAGPVSALTLYEIYAIDKKWDGDLQDIILGLKHSIQSQTILPCFGPMRLLCQKRCNFDSKCHICYDVKKFADNMYNHNLKIDFDVQ